MHEMLWFPRDKETLTALEWPGSESFKVRSRQPPGSTITLPMASRFSSSLCPSLTFSSVNVPAMSGRSVPAMRKSSSSLLTCFFSYKKRLSVIELPQEKPIRA